MSDPEQDVVPAASRWAAWKDRLSIAAVILLLIGLVLMLFLDAVENYQCSPWQFVTFQCNRFDASFKPWK